MICAFSTLGAFTFLMFLHPQNASRLIVLTLDGIAISFNEVQSRKAKLNISVTPSGITTDLSDAHPSNAWHPMLVTFSGISIASNFIHPSKVPVPILSTLYGIFILFKDEQPLKAPYSIFVTVSGSTSVTKLEHPRNAYDPISSTSLGITISLSFLHPSNAPSIRRIFCGSFTDLRDEHLENMKSIVSTLASEMSICSKPVHPLNTVETSLTPLGKLTVLSFSQSLNASLCISFTSEGIVSDLRDAHPSKARQPMYFSVNGNLIISTSMRLAQA